MKNCVRCGSSIGFRNKLGYMYFYKGLCPECARKEKAFNSIQKDTVPRRRQTEYRIWRLIKDRCDNPRSHAYKDYGGRGIRMCREWYNYETFLKDMGRRPSKEHSIDRIDVNGDYCPENCRWATWHQQAANRRNKPMVTGICWDRSYNRWHAALTVGGKLVFVHNFKSYKNAVVARRLAEKLYNIKID